MSTLMIRFRTQTKPTVFGLDVVSLSVLSGIRVQQTHYTVEEAVHHLKCEQYRFISIVCVQKWNLPAVSNYSTFTIIIIIKLHNKLNTQTANKTIKESKLKRNEKLNK